MIRGLLLLMVTSGFALRHSAPRGYAQTRGGGGALGSVSAGNVAGSVGTSGNDTASGSSAADSAPVEGGVIIPVEGVQRAALRDTFDEGRAGHTHHAIDILAPRGTPVVAAVDGQVVKLFTSAAGGLTIYQFDRARQFVYYYAHLDSYAASLGEGMSVRQGTVIGYVGTSGNAPPGTPHLHFAIERLGPEKVWWRSEAIDPYPILMAGGAAQEGIGATVSAR
jgi:peptidoglycan LD-endopeptidase LytH